jgi:hypothetical protein
MLRLVIFGLFPGFRLTWIREQSKGGSTSAQPGTMIQSAAFRDVRNVSQVANGTL